MSARAKKLSEKDQRERFEAEVARMIDAGELNPIEASERLSKLVGVARAKSTS